MIWRCINREMPCPDYDDERRLFDQHILSQHLDRGGYGQGPEYLLGFEALGDGVGMGFDHGMLNGDNVKWGDR